jgi:hypothetical protein
MDSRYGSLVVGAMLVVAVTLLGVAGVDGGRSTPSLAGDGAGRALLVGATPTATFTPAVVLRLPLVRRSHISPSVTGSVLLEGGACCTGGRAGDTIHIDAEFEASSPYAAVVDMRVATRYGFGCLTEAELTHADWEPFVAAKSFPITVGLNWIGYYVTVQYRDAAGHISPVYCDDISVEGMPPPP